ncbi:MAG: FixH family protein [Deltaproteobacteria bacterium]
MMPSKRILALLLILLLFLSAASAGAKSYELRKKVGNYEAEVRMDRNPPSLGDNNIEIEIKDAGGKPLTEATVLVNYYMPPMPRMAPMNYITDAKLKGEKYKATMNFIMSGPWIIAVKITHGGKTSTAKFNIDAQ